MALTSQEFTICFINNNVQFRKNEVGWSEEDFETSSGSQSSESDFSSFSPDELLQLIGDASVMGKVLHQLALHLYKNPSWFSALAVVYFLTCIKQRLVWREIIHPLSNTQIQTLNSVIMLVRSRGKCVGITMQSALKLYQFVCWIIAHKLAKIIFQNIWSILRL